MIRATLLFWCSLAATAGSACESTAACQGSDAGCGVDDPELSFASQPLFEDCPVAAATDLKYHVTVGTDRSFTLRIVTTAADIVSGTLRAEVLPLRPDATALTVPLVRSEDTWSASATVSWPEDGVASFRVRVAGREAVGEAEVQAARRDVKLSVGAFGAVQAGLLLPLRAEVTCGGQPLARQTVSFASLPDSTILPAIGQTSDEGILLGTLRLANADSLPLRVDAIVGAERDGCTITAGGTITAAGTCASF